MCKRNEKGDRLVDQLVELLQLRSENLRVELVRVVNWEDLESIGGAACELPGSNGAIESPSSSEQRDGSFDPVNEAGKTERTALLSVLSVPLIGQRRADGQLRQRTSVEREITARLTRCWASERRASPSGWA